MTITSKYCLALELGITKRQLEALALRCGVQFIAKGNRGALAVTEQDAQRLRELHQLYKRIKKGVESDELHLY